MSKASPFNSKNAIEAVSFAINFSRNFEPNELEQLLSLEKVLKDDFPIFNRMEGIGFEVTQNHIKQVINDVARLQGISMQRVDENLGKISWQLRINNSSLHVICSDYDSWDCVWPKALGYLNKVASFLNLDTLSVVSLGCQIVDKFVYLDGSDNYHLEDIFNPSSEFLTSNIKSSGELWHVYQGWFEKTSPISDSKLLSQLNITNSIIGNYLTATIDHVNQCLWREPILLGREDFLKSVDGLLGNVFNAIHEANKGVLRKLLSSEKIQMIGLNK